MLANLDYDTTGYYVSGRLIQGPDGTLYGASPYGGSGYYGTVLKVDETGLNVLQSFDFSMSGGGLGDGLVLGADGLLYGVTRGGGSGGNGRVFSFDTDGSGFAFLGDLGGYGDATLMRANDGRLYGTTSWGGSTGQERSSGSSTDGTGFSNLKSNFSTGPDVSEEGGYPTRRVIQATDGTLYGLTSAGAAGAGAAYKVGPEGDGFTVIREFDPSEAYPPWDLIQGMDGSLYGTGKEGGVSYGGTVFTLNTDGTGFALLKQFDWSSGSGLSSGLLQGQDGALYGAAASGGSFGGGTVFKLSTDGASFTVLEDMDYLTTGVFLTGTMIQGTDGALYGTTVLGGSGGAGTVFRMNSDGTDFTVLKSFVYSTGAYPEGGVIQGTDGALYGTTAIGGSTDSGTIFKLNTDGSDFTILQDLDYFTSLIAYPGRLVQGPDGALYGTSAYGGSAGYGTVFRLNTDGSDLSIVANFDFVTNGGYPRGDLVLGSDGNLYGTVADGGAGGAGTVFRLVFTSTDALAPTAGPTQSPAANAAGWNNGDVTVTWNWVDEAGGSGIDAANCPATTQSTGEGAGSLLQGTCQDLAGNTASASHSVNVDKMAPTVSMTGGPGDGGSYFFGAVPAAPTCSASDGISGVASCSVSGYGTAVGSHTVTATATDHAGNVASASATYVVFPWTISGFFHPVDMGGVWNTVRAGSTVPLKFEAFVGSTELTSTAAVVQPLTASQTACSGGPVDDVELVSVGGTSLSYYGQFTYNWQTPRKPGFCYVVTVQLADGTAVSAKFRLR